MNRGISPLFYFVSINRKPRGKGRNTPARLHGQGHRVCLNRIEDQAVGHRDQDRKEARKEGRANHVADVVGRTTRKTALRTLDLVDLSKRRFHKARSRADRCDHPHPEHGARTTENHRDGNARDVAHAHARSG